MPSVMVTFYPEDGTYDYILYTAELKNAGWPNSPNQRVLDLSSSRVRTMRRNMARVVRDTEFLERIFTESEMTGRTRFLT